jgi:hypothetical protein
MMFARIAVTLALIMLAFVFVFIAMLFGADPEGRGGKAILIFMALSLLSVLSIFPTWLLFRHH